MPDTPRTPTDPMLDYLSVAWLEALDEAVRADEALAAATLGCDLVIEQVAELGRRPTPGGTDGSGDTPEVGPVVGPDGSRADGDDPAVAPWRTPRWATIVWQVRLVDGRPQVVSGSAGPPTVRFTTDLATAESISRGTEPAQAAFLRGDLRIGGDTAALAERRELLASVADVAASLRHRTRFPSDAGGA